jgi:hypothetical protein
MEGHNSGLYNLMATPCTRIQLLLYYDQYNKQRNKIVHLRPNFLQFLLMTSLSVPRISRMTFNQVFWFSLVGLQTLLLVPANCQDHSSHKTYLTQQIVMMFQQLNMEGN